MAAESMPPAPSLGASQLVALSRKRLWVSMAYTLALLALYFGFILLVAYAKPLLAMPIASGFTVALLLAALVVLGAFALTCVYGSWIAQFEINVQRLVADEKGQ